MKIIKKNVYYCDYCGKKSLSAGILSKHERHCTANPNRNCRLCNNNIDISPFITDLMKRFDLIEVIDDYGVSKHSINWKGEPITLREILEYTDYCPNCTFAILRQTKLNYSVFGFQYDYKKELADFWSERNR